jgi:hypothetical protein
VNFVTIIVSALIALGAAVNAGGPQASSVATSAAGAVAPTPTPAPTNPPVRYDALGGGAPTK